MSAKQALNEHNAVARALSQKWGYLLEGIKSDAVRGTTAILLENESQRGHQLMTETGTFSGQTATAGGYDFSAGNGTGAGNDIAPFQHYLLPLVRRVYPNLIANELVGVQPMTSPASLVFYLKYKYTGLVNPDVVSNGVVTSTATAKGQTAAGTEYANFSGNTWAIDPYYSLQTVFRESPLQGAAAVTATGLVTTPLAQPVVPSTVVVNAGTITLALRETVTTTDKSTLAVTINTAGQATGAPVITTTGGAGVDTLASTIVLGTQIVNMTTGVVTIPFTSGVTAELDPTVASTSTAARSYDYNMEGNRTMPEMELQVESNPVAAKTRKLRTKWTIEAAQDLRAMHNIDAEQELIAVLANEVTAEIDREIINDLLVNAAIRVTYDYSNPFIVGGQGTLTGQTPLGVANFAVAGATNFDDRNKALFYQILECSAQIYRQSLRGSGNWIVTSPEVSAKLESLTEFKPDAKSDTTYNMGISYAGTLNGAFKVYKDPLFPKDKILVGYKGQSFMDAGYFYCPYVPLQLTPTVLDTESFNPRKGLITRYGKVLVENGARMYARISVSNLTAIGADALPTYYNGTTPDAQKSTGAITAAVAGSTLI